MKGISKLVSAFLIICISISTCYAEGFYDQRYRGWLWFEDKENANKLEKQDLNSSEISPEAAKEEMEQFSKGLEELKFVMFARPTPENVKAYRDKEKEMWDKAMLLQASWDMANFQYPEQRDQINNPDNVHGVKLKRKLEREEQAKNIREFASSFELVAFFKSDCRYCHEFAPVLASFVQEFGFGSETCILDDPTTASKYSNLSNKLNIEATPTLFAISKDGNTAFELVRGFVSTSELKSSISMAWKYLELKGFKRSFKGDSK